MKFNASVYTFMDDTEMEIVNKNIEIENKIYYVFKKQIKNNILTLYCLPNKSISETAVNISKIINNDFETKPNLSRKGLEKAYKIFDKDYVTNDLYEKEFLVLFLNQKPTSDFTFQNNILKGFLFKDILPPKNSIA